MAAIRDSLRFLFLGFEQQQCPVFFGCSHFLHVSGDVIKSRHILSLFNASGQFPGSGMPLGQTHCRIDRHALYLFTPAQSQKARVS